MFRVIAVDDEKKALDRFERIAAEEPRISVDGKFTSAAAALEFIRSNLVDIAFLDIEMPGIGGLELAEMLSVENADIEIVFITAYDKYALKAFQAHAIGYLLKPLDIADIREQIDLLERKLRYRKPGDRPKHLTVKCFGQFTCRADEDGEPIRWRTAKAEELFALLIHYQGRAILKDILIDILWPEAEPEKAVNNFRVTCTYLRNTFSDKGFPNILLRERDNYKINTAMLQCDLNEFIKASGAPAPGCGELEAASDFFSGAYFENKPYEWANETRVWLENRFKKVQYRLAEEYCAHGEESMAARALERVLQHDPLEEEAVEKLISIKLNAGDSVSAIKLYYDYEQKLFKELGAKPSARLRTRMKKVERR